MHGTLLELQNPKCCATSPVSSRTPCTPIARRRRGLALHGWSCSRGAPPVDGDVISTSARIPAPAAPIVVEGGVASTSPRRAAPVEPTAVGGVNPRCTHRRQRRRSHAPPSSDDDAQLEGIPRRRPPYLADERLLLVCTPPRARRRQPPCRALVGGGHPSCALVGDGTPLLRPARAAVLLIDSLAPLVPVVLSGRGRKKCVVQSSY